ncbi:MAG: hypothetical protein ACREQ8_00555, partial [Woeseiaceae bacterium]
FQDRAKQDVSPEAHTDVFMAVLKSPPRSSLRVPPGIRLTVLVTPNAGGINPVTILRPARIMWY